MYCVTNVGWWVGVCTLLQIWNEFDWRKLSTFILQLAIMNHHAPLGHYIVHVVLKCIE